jgi:endoglucanase
MPRRSPAIVTLVALVGVIAGSLTAGGVRAANAVKLIAPPEVPGIAVYIPYDVAIKVDGKLNDWAAIPVQTVDYGPLTASNFLEGGQFQFQVAADQTNLYITATSVDKTIVAGQHGTNFWNEDSLEFYLNTSGNLDSHNYAPKIWQVNINAADIGKKDPKALVLTGVNSDKIHVSGYVFKTTTPQAGWGFEASVPMADLGIVPTAGLEIGFSAQMNSARVQDRDVQLNWSKADTNNTSFQDPAKFGTAIFFKVGQKDIPVPARVAPTPTPRPGPAKPQVSVNQVGYFPLGTKIASFATASTKPLDWKLVDSAGASMMTGQTTVFGADSSSGVNVHLIDFSYFTTAGKGYKLLVGDVASDTFDVADDLYAPLQKDALAYYYRSRSGIALTAQYAGDAWARAAGHTSDKSVTCYKGKDINGVVWPGCDYSLDVSGGWYDAGDYGKYVVNGGISVWTLMNQYEMSPSSFGDGTLNIPENKNGVPDILDEARWELKFMLGMQVPAGQKLAGMVHHKIHDDVWAAIPFMPPTEATNRYLFPPSTAATLNLAAVGAQCARIWKTIDPEFSARCLTAAETAWTAAKANPAEYAVSFAAGGGDYGDKVVDDEFYWAAAELYVTTGKDVYKDAALASPKWADASVPSWDRTGALGTISLAMISGGLSSDKIDACRKSIIATAEFRLTFLDRQGYRVPLANFVWGSNGEALNSAMLMGVAYKANGDRRFLDGATLTLDYVLGRNALNQSYVTGYGTKPVEHPHHRFWANQPTNGFPAPPPGVVAGGPNEDPNDTAAQQAGLTGNPAEKAYIDNLGSFTTNEVTINWNAPFAWVTAFVNAEQTKAPVTPATTPSPGSNPDSPKDETSSVWPVVGVAVLLLFAVATAFLLWFRRRNGVAGA